jgi:hypothetical protein
MIRVAVVPRCEDKETRGSRAFKSPRRVWLVGTLAPHYYSNPSASHFPRSPGDLNARVEKHLLLNNEGRAIVTHGRDKSPELNGADIPNPQPLNHDHLATESRLRK